MSRILTVATSEFHSSVRTKAFIIGVVAMPLFMGGAIAIQALLQERVDTRDRPFAVIDSTGVLYDSIEAAARERNKPLTGADGERPGSRYLPSRVEATAGSPEELRFELSERVRAGELFAFVEIPAGALDENDGEAVRYYSEEATYNDLRRWLREVINDEIRRRRFMKHQLDGGLVDRISRRVQVENLGLVSKTEEGGDIRDAEKVDEVRTYGVPAGLMFLLFMVVMTSAPQLVSSVLEEKLSRISEVILGSVSPFQFMMGKLIGSVWVALLLAAIYLGGGYVVASHYGYSDVLSAGLFVWFALFLVLAVCLFGSFSIAIGAACTDFKDTQSLMMPVMLIFLIPMFVWMNVLQAPSSAFSVALSLFPPATPMLMLLRLAIPPGPPLWQVLLSVVLTAAMTVACVWAAGKIFRTGILMQGKSASLRELVRWLLA